MDTLPIVGADGGDVRNYLTFILNGKKIIRRKSNRKKLSNGKLKVKRNLIETKKPEPIKSNGKL